MRKKHRLWDVSLDESTETEQPSSRLDVEDQGLNPEQFYAQKERQRILSEAMNELAQECEKQSSCVSLTSDRRKRPPESMGISVGAVKARVFQWAKEIAREIEALCRISLDVRKGRFTNDR